MVEPSSGRGLVFPLCRSSAGRSLAVASISASLGALSIRNMCGKTLYCITHPYFVRLPVVKLKAHVVVHCRSNVEDFKGSNSPPFYFFGVEVGEDSYSKRDERGVIKAKSPMILFVGG